MGTGCDSDAERATLDLRRLPSEFIGFYQAVGLHLVIAAACVLETMSKEAPPGRDNEGSRTPAEGIALASFSPEPDSLSLASI